MIKLSIPTNWQEDLIPYLSSIEKDLVGEIYGKLNADFIGGGRASFALPSVSKKRARNYIGKLRRLGFKFNYLLNSTCMGNKEWSTGGQKRLNKLLDWIAEAGATSVTVSIPYLLEVVKKRCPDIDVYVSTMAGVNSTQRAKFWEELGADKITLAETSMNRNFRLLKKIRRNVKCKLQLIANLDCLYNCPYWIYHGVLNSHSSQDGYCSRNFMIDYCSLSCNYKKLKNPVELIRSGWIRPEDIHHYEEAGIDGIKLVNRGMTTKNIARVVTAYLNRRYDGNLLDLFSRPSRNIIFEKKSLFHKIKYFLRPFSVNLFRLARIKKVFSEPGIYIDNKLLGGFIEYFINGNCDDKECQSCTYCKETAEKAMHYQPEQIERNIKNYEAVLEDIVTGKMFFYN